MFLPKIIKEFSQNLDENKLLKAYNEFQKYTAKKDAIKTFKEEVYQDGFLKDVFENCLGYTLDTTNPENFNLKREMKNETDAKKADGVIIVNGEVVGIIELKDTTTKDLNKVESQAFNYHNSHANSRYIIISNFEKLRFYIDKKIEFVEFNLFDLNFTEFKKFYLLLNFNSIKNNTPLLLKEQSLNFQTEISKRFYNDYSDFRLNLFENLIKNNPEIPKNELLSYTSKLCDRIIFILFAEDKALLKPNTIKTIEEDFKNQKYTNFSLYEMYKFYFNAINKGDEKLGIKAYNGGLFASDEALDNLLIDDDALNASKLSQYDFASEVSVNILGHIFEQSLNDLEEITANIHGGSFDKTKSQRKKDGIFYTPEFITKFIVSKTLGEICKDKKEILRDITPPKNQNRLTKKDRENLDKIYAYKDFLLNLKILDPACGSGAFLNEAMNFLINEHKFCDDLRREFDGDALGLFDVETAILENNLYGVDINQTAAEIAKLSLWLRSAQVGRKLTNLSNNIKTANSLLDFPFKDIKFDVVIGNPPYVRIQGLKENWNNESQIYEKKFISATGNYDIYVLFLEFGYGLLKKDGKLGFIVPHNFLTSDFGSGIRNFLYSNKAVEKLVHFGSNIIFSDASVYTCILILSQNNKTLKFKNILPKDIFNDFIFNEKDYLNLSDKKWVLTDKISSQILNKINSQPHTIKDIFKGVFQGIISGDNKAFYLKNCKDDGDYVIGYNEVVSENIRVEKKATKKILNGKTIKKYYQTYNNDRIFYLYKTNNGKTENLSENFIQTNLPLTYKFLIKIKNRLENRKTKATFWYSLFAAKDMKILSSKKIITPDICYGSSMFFDEKGEFFYNDTAYSLVLNDEKYYKAYLLILNSNLLWFYLQNTSSELRGGYFRFKKSYLEPFGIPQIPADKMSEFENLANELLNLNENLKTTKNAFLTELNLDKLPKTLENFELLEFDEFIDEFTKALKLKFKDKLDERNFKNQWERIFMHDKNEVLNLQSKISKLDKNADDLVYKLFDLSDDEIKFIENEMR